MKKRVLALLMLATTCVATSVHADDCVDYGMYVSGFAGGNMSHEHGHGIQFNPGIAGGAALGYKFENNIRVEGEVAVRRNKIRHIDIHANTYSAMGNVYYDFENDSDFTPYIGAGAGYAKTEASMKIGHTNISGSKNGFAYQGIGGVSYKIADKTHLGLEYRYFRAHKQQQNHTVALSLKRYF